MNKIFRVIWNTSTQTWVAVSELAKGHTKTKSSTAVNIEVGYGASFAISALATLVLGATSTDLMAANLVSTSTPIYAETNAPAPTYPSTSSTTANGNTTGTTNNILIGQTANIGKTTLVTTTTKNGVTTTSSKLGAYNAPTAIENVVIGHNSTAAGNGNIVIGRNSFTWSEKAPQLNDQIVIGTNSTTAGASAVAIGSNSFVSATNGLAIGNSVTAKGQNATAIGANASTDSAGATAIGMDSIATYINSVAVGAGANATFAHAVAVGSGSVTEQATAEGTITVNSIVYDNAAGVTANGKEGKQNASYVVSFGNETVKRQLKNVAPGKISSDSTDAINGSQLYSITSGLQDSTKTYLHVNSTLAGNNDYLTKAAQATGANAMALGPNAAASGENSTAISTNSLANATNALAAGVASQATGEDAVALGSASTAVVNATAVGANALAKENATALGKGASANAESAVAVGKSSDASEENATALGTNATAQAANSTSLGANAIAQSENATAVGAGAQALRVGSIALGQATSNGNQSVAIGTNSTATQKGSVTIGAGSSTSADYAIAIGGSPKALAAEAAKAAGIRSIVLGSNAQSGSSADSGVAIGTDSNVSGINSVAIGKGAVATHQNSVALGSNSVTSAHNDDVSYMGRTDKEKDTVSVADNFAGEPTQDNGSISVGAVGKERQIFNVAKGRVNPTSTDAVNGSQLYHVAQSVGFNIRENGAAKSRINNNGIVDMTNGTYTAVVVTDGDNASTIKYNVVTQNLTTAANGTVSPTGSTAGLTTAQTVADAINNATYSFNIQANGVGAEKVTKGQTVNFKQGNNIEITRNGKDITVKTKDDVTFNTLTTTQDATITGSLNANGGLVVGADSSVDMGNNKIQNVADGENDSDAVNLSQLKNNITNVTTELTDKGMKFSGNEGDATPRKLGETLNIAGGATATGDYSAANVKTVVSEGKVEIQFAQDPTFNNVTAANGTITNLTATNATITNGNITELTAENATLGGADKSVIVQAGTTINMGDNKVQGVAAGDINDKSTDAVNGAQLYSVQETANKGWQIKGQNTKVGDVKPGNEVDFVKGAGTTATVTGADGSYTVKYDVNAGSGLRIEGDQLVANETVVAAGNNIKSVEKTTALGTTTYTVNAADYNAGAGVSITGDKTTGYTIKADVASIKAGNDNVTVTNTDGVVTISAVDTNTQATVEAQDNTVAVTSDTTNGNGTKVYKVKSNYTAGAGVTITGNQISATGTSITAGDNVAVTGDATNGYTVKANGTKVVQGKGVTVTNTTEGSNTTYTVNANVASVTGGSNVNLVNTDGNVVVDLNTTTLSANPNGTVQAAQTGNTFANASEVVKAINAAGWNITAAANGGELDGSATNEQINPGDSVKLQAGTNLKVKQEGSNFTYSTKDDVTFTSVSTSDLTANGNTTLGGADKNVTIAGGSNISMGGNQVHNVEAGNADKDAVNVKQLNDKVANSSWNLQANNAEGEAIKPTNNVSFNEGKNINITRDGANITVKTVDNPTFTDVQADSLNATNVNATKVNATTVNATEVNATNVNATKVNATTVNATNVTTTDLTATGNTSIGGADKTFNVVNGTTVNMGNNVVTGVGKGTISESSTDAVNGSQLYSVQEVANKGWNATVSKTGTGVSSGTGVNIKPGEALDYVAGDNIEIAQDDHKITIKTSANPTFTKVQAGEVNATTVNATEVNATNVNATKVNATTVNATNVTTTDLTATGNTTIGGADKNFNVVTGTTINMGNNQIHGVANGTADTDAVNLSQLNATTSSLTTKGLDFTGNDGKTHRDLGQTLNITGNATSTGDYSSANVKTVVTEGKVEIQFAQDPTFNNIQANKLNATTVNATNVNATEVNATTVNATTVNATDVNTTNVTAKKGTITDLTSTNATITNGNISELTAGNATIGGADKSLTVKAGTTISMGGNKVQDVAKGEADTDAVNVKQLNDTIGNSSWNLQANNQAGQDIKPTNNVSFNEGKNINITRSGANITVKTVDNPTFTDVQADSLNATNVNATKVNATTVNATDVNATKVNATTVNATNVTTTDLTATGNTTIGGADKNFNVVTGTTINMGNNQIHGVANGTADTDAVNLSQLNATTSSLTTKGLDFTGNSGKTHRDLGQTLNITGNATSTGDYSSANVKTVVTEGKVEIQFAQDPTFNNIQANKLNATEVNATTVNATNVNATEVNATTVNATKVNATDVNTTNVTAAKGTITDLTSTNATITNGNISELTAGNATIGGADKSLTVKAGTTISMGGNKVQGVAKGEADTDAVNVKQLNDTIGNSSWNLQANNQAGQDIKPTNNVSFNEGKNINITRSGANITVRTVDNPTFTDVKTDTLNATTVNASTVNATDVNATNVNATNVNATKVNATTVNATNVTTTDLTATGNTTIGGADKTFNVVTGTTINMGNNQIHGVANGTADTDAVNLSQLNATTNTLTTKGLDFTGNDGKTHRDLGTILNISGAAKSGNAYSANNVKTVVTDDGVEIQISENPTFNDIQANSLNATNVNATNVNTTNVTAAKGTITDLTSTNATITNLVATSGNISTLIAGNSTFGGMGKTFVIQNGTDVNMGNNVVKGVANGEVSETSKEAVNGSQLYSVQEVANKGWNATVSQTGTGVGTGKGVNIKPGEALDYVAGDNIEIAQDDHKITIKTSTNPTFTKVQAGEVNATSVNATNVNATNVNATTVNATTVNATDVNTTNVTAAKGVITDLTSTNATITNLVATSGNIATFVAGNSTFGGEGKTFVIQKGTNVNMGGNQIHGVANGTADTDAVNLSQLNATTNALTTKGLDFTGNDGKTHRDLGTTLNISGAAKSGNAYSANNVKTVVTDNGVEIQISENPTFNDIQANSLNATNVNATTVNATDVNATNVNATNGTFTNLNTTNANISELTAGNATVGGEGKNLTVLGNTTVNMGGNRVQNVGDAQEDGDAVNYKQVKDSIANSSWGLQANGGAAAPIKPNTNVSFNNGKNIEITRDGNNITVKTVDNPSFTNINAENGTFANLTAGNATVTNLTSANATFTDSLVSSGNTTIGGAGKDFSVVNGTNVNMGNNQIHNVANGTADGDAVNLSQLKSNITNLSDSITSKGLDFTGNAGETHRNLGQTLNISGNATTAGNYTSNNVKTVVTEGKVEIQIAENPTFANVTATNVTTQDFTANGNSTVGGGKGTSFNVVNGTTVNMGGNVITNIGEGAIAEGSKNAVTGNQLYTVQNDLVNKGLNFQGNEGDIAPRKLGETLNITGEAGAKGAYNGKNVKTVSYANGTVAIQVAENPTFNSIAVKDIDVDNLKAGNATLGGNGNSVTIANGTTVNMGNNVVDGVADGKLSNDSKQAVNGSQLAATNQVIGGNATIVTKEFQLANGSTISVPVAVDESGKEYTLVTYNVKGQSEVHNNNVISAIHNMNEQGIKFFHTNDGQAQPNAQGANSIDSSAGGSFSTAVGYRANAEGESALAIGNEAQAIGTQSVSVGAKNNVRGSFSAAVGSGNTVESANSFVFGSNVRNTLDNSVFLGANTGYVKAGNTTAGNEALESQTINDTTYAYAGGKANEVVGVVSVGNVDEKGVSQTRRVQNVAPGLISATSTDAINGSQLHSTIQNVNTQMNSVVNQVNNQFTSVNNRIGTIDRDLRSGIAGAVAQASLVQAYNPSDALLAVGGGTYRGASALALGYSKVSDNGKIILKVTGSVNNAGHYSGGASVGYKF